MNEKLVVRLYLLHLHKSYQRPPIACEPHFENPETAGTKQLIFGAFQAEAEG